MEKLSIALAVMVVTAGAAPTSGLKKGNLVGVHPFTVQLKPGVTKQQYIDFVKTRYIPAVEKYLPGPRIHLAKRTRGTEDRAELDLALIFVFPSEKERDKWFAKDNLNEFTQEAQLIYDQKLAPVVAEIEKLGTKPSSTYTDWVMD